MSIADIESEVRYLNNHAEEAQWHLMEMEKHRGDLPDDVVAYLETVRHDIDVLVEGTSPTF